MTSSSKIQFADSPNLDAFARLRVSEPANQFDSQMQYNLQPLLWESVVTGGGAGVTHLPAESAARMRVSTASGDKVIRQTYRYMRYRPGKSQMVLMTGVMGPQKTGVRQRIGYFDNSNGIFFQQDSTGLAVVVRTSTSGEVVDHVTYQDSWNLDTMDGVGPSTHDIDMTKANIFMMDFEWLGVGRVRFGFVVNGLPVYCHHVLNANNTEHVYMATANLPLRYEIENVAETASNTDMLQICSMVASEGGDPLTSGMIRSINTGTSTVSVSTRRAILSIRPKLTFNSMTNRATILPETFDLYVDGTVDVMWEVVRGGTIGGSPSWASASDHSVVEYDLAGTTVTGGEVLASGYAVGGGSGGPGNSNPLGGASAAALSASGLTTFPLTLNYAGDASIPLSLVITGIGGTAAVGGSMTWAEIA